VSNPARISRMPYTINSKAQRRSSVIEYPKDWQPVMAGKVWRLAREGGLKTDYDVTRTQSSSTLAIDEDGVYDLIEEYPDQLHLDHVSQQDEKIFFALASCPFKGAPHRDQNVGRGHTSIILRPNSIGFSCFGSECADRTFGDLLRLLHEQTGRWPSVEIWDDDLALEARWCNGIVNVHEPDPVEEFLCD